MKLPIYETALGATRALLASRQFAKIDLYTMELVGGEVMRFSAGDVNVAIPAGNTWDSHTVRFDDPDSKALGSWKTGLDVAQWQVRIYPRTHNPVTGALYPDVIGGIPWIQAVVGGALDGATITVDRAYFAGWPSPPQAVINPVGVYRLFVGRTAEVEAARGGLTLSISSLTDLLNIQMPRDLYQALCFHRLFDAGCGLNQADFAVTGAVAVTPSTNIVVNTAIGAPGGSGTYSLGRILMTSGANTGLQRTIKAWTPGTSFSLITPFFYTPQPGDTFTAYPGCEKSQLHCTLFFGLPIAETNYGGTPYTPQAESAV